MCFTLLAAWHRCNESAATSCSDNTINWSDSRTTNRFFTGTSYGNTWNKNLFSQLTAVFFKLVQCQPRQNPEIQPIFFQDFHYLDKKPLTWGSLYTLWEVPIARIWKNICGKVIFGVPEMGGFGGVDDL